MLMLTLVGSVVYFCMPLGIRKALEMCDVQAANAA